MSGYLGAIYGGSTVQQQAAFVLVTPKQVRAAGGVAEAYVIQAGDLARLVRDQQQGLVDDLGALLVQAEARLARGGKGVEKALDAIAGRILERAIPLDVPAALKVLQDTRVQLMPYTDQKQPMKVEAKHEGLPPPAVIVMGSPGEPQTLDAQGFGEMVLIGEAVEVTPARSQGEPET